MHVPVVYWVRALPSIGCAISKRAYSRFLVVIHLHIIASYLALSCYLLLSAKSYLAGWFVHGMFH